MIKTALGLGKTTAVCCQHNTAASLDPVSQLKSFMGHRHSCLLCKLTDHIIKIQSCSCSSKFPVVKSLHSAECVGKSPKTIGPHFLDLFKSSCTVSHSCLDLVFLAKSKNSICSRPFRRYGHMAAQFFIFKGIIKVLHHCHIRKQTTFFFLHSLVYRIDKWSFQMNP